VALTNPQWFREYSSTFLDHSSFRLTSG